MEILQKLRLGVGTPSSCIRSPTVNGSLKMFFSERSASPLILFDSKNGDGTCLFRK